MADSFSDYLELLSARSIVSGGLITGGDWAVSFPASPQIKFWGVQRGSCWLLMAGATAAVRVEEGDVFLLCAPSSHTLASNLNTVPVPLDEILARRTGSTARHGEGDEFFMIGGKVELDADHGRLLLDALPPLIHVPGSSAEAANLKWLLNELLKERENALPGSETASTQMAHLVFIYILRAYFAKSESVSASWLRAVSDQRLAPALRLMHGEPGRAWGLEELAKASAMSRAGFAAYFRAVAGVAPIAYLTQWRMLLAMQMLRDTRKSLGELADLLGYASESSFSNAFKRVVGQAPRIFRDALEQR
ncbi:AraC family transcriptional regulator [Pseudomonas gingeri]|uniref:AraC family transcriptional regulator n=1 Tax=Pseudomonas gingeri TaxID=117681 RepID=A0A7Y7YCH5_9PSED|nr:AraC family transcriptional regulator [Pseudomonas gingeri]NWC33939.1 AraC family transcriptional regulator [Pseudomonas gingeri]NWD03759.1 AraC family transcriptional regulator [Pseudomonas gingeri]NWD48133.1 AraC family transcriptional regulator [Pseudomonas gingeri]NWE33557.1 AraC family transcriptional regulator [Pseudomonas gingeri]